MTVQRQLSSQRSDMISLEDSTSRSRSPWLPASSVFALQWLFLPHGLPGSDMVWAGDDYSVCSGVSGRLHRNLKRVVPGEPVGYEIVLLHETGSVRFEHRWTSWSFHWKSREKEPDIHQMRTKQQNQESLLHISVPESGLPVVRQILVSLLWLRQFSV